MVQSLLEATPEAYAAAPRDDRLRHALRKLWTIPSFGLTPYTTVAKKDLDSLIEITPGLGSDLMLYMATPTKLLHADEWDLTASRVYQCVKASTHCDWGSAESDMVSIDAVAAQLGLSKQEVFQAGVKIGGGANGEIMFVRADEDHHIFWAGTSKPKTQGRR